MFLLTQNEINIIITVATIIILVLIAFGFLLCFLYRKKFMSKSDKATFEKHVQYHKLLDDFFNALGGTKNIKSIKNNAELNYLSIELIELDKINELEIHNLGALKIIFEDTTINIFFIDSTSFYNSLFGK